MYDAKHSMEDEKLANISAHEDDEPNSVYFLEVYDDKEGHATHRTMPHYDVLRSCRQVVENEKEPSYYP